VHDSYHDGGGDSELKEMRECFEFAWNEGADNRREYAMDLRYIAGDPWPDAEKQQRRTPGSERVYLVFDELNQYTNLVVNTQMQKRLGVKVIPEGEGSNDESARMEENTIRGIEYRSKAQLAYVSGFEGAVHGGFGGWQVTKDYLPGSWDQELAVKPIYNSQTYIVDGKSVEVDGSDQENSWIINRIGKHEFERKYPKAKFLDFTSETVTMAPLWFGYEDIQIAAWWKKRMKRRKLLLIQRPGIQTIDGQFIEGETVQGFAEELRKGGADISGKQVFIKATGELFGSIVRDRWDEMPEVSCCITNGIEILEETPWDGKWIPLIPCYGKILWVDRGSGPKRELHSLIRLARDPQMAMNYTKTAIVETIGQMPKGGIIGYEGQFEGHEDEFAESIKIPKAFLQVKAVTEATGTQILPLPTMRQFSADIAAAQSASEDFRRSIQAAVGQNALPTAAQARSEKSGVALDRIADAQAIGSYHFVQHFEASIMMTGRILEDLLDKTYDTERTVGMRKEDGSYEMGKVTPGAFKAAHGVTISSGPTDQSQRQTVEKLAESLMGSELYGPRVAWLAIKLLNLGPLGDQISDLLKPPDLKEDGEQDPAAQAQKIAELTQQLQEREAILAEMQQEIVQFKAGIQAKELDGTFKLEVTKMVEENKRWIALLDARTKVALPAVQHRFKAEEIEQQGEIDEELAEVEHEQAIEDADISHEHATEQMETAADLAPEPKGDNE